MLGPPLIASCLRGLGPMSMGLIVVGRMPVLVPSRAAATAIPPIGSRVHSLALLGLALRSVEPFDVVVEHLLDRLERLHVLRRHQGSCITFAPGAARAADAVDIVLGVD